MINTEFMKAAIEIAKQAGTDLPIGAVIVKDGKIIASAHNEKEKLQNAAKHAEMIVIEQASKKSDNWRLEDCDLYVTLEPCPMCAWAILQSRFKNVYFGAYDGLYGALGSKIDVRDLLGAKINIKGGILEQECRELLDSYFKELRNGK